MYTLIELQKKLLPDMLSVMQKRFQILRSIHFMEPVGRRTLAQVLGFSERVLRSEVEFLNEQKLITIKMNGMSVSEQGLSVLEGLSGMMREISGINEMEEKLKELLNLQEVVIVPGDSDETPWVKQELGRACAKRMKKRLVGKNTIAVAGGSTMAAVADMISADFIGDSNTVFVPARGGIGEDVKNEANSVCAKMAENTGAKHRVLYVPDQVSKEVYQSFIKEPIIKEVLHLIKNADMVLHGIGDANVMAKRRNTKEEDMKLITNGHAVGEAFGYYFNEAGQVVHKVPTVGLQLQDLQKIKHVIAVAGGSSKAKAIKACMKSATKSTVLITDEGAATKMIGY
ncbi:sugar-binding transcriptional regulator [Heyndrickxia oleronia]|uniref:sugar-binding transcriptional regulator n=1 Tax=Heyndrickxia oleronia TaxID=38875 RepID=UPI00203A5F61|nr:sugar-binding transcriptional regulator [Heyndrickxia oleronia]MCM3238254.1 sugar-binding transcriptional regulator [Heyndrickxia oleronia]